jgi:predicted permease
MKRNGWPPQDEDKNAQLQDEIASHLKMATRDRLDRGQSPEDAAQAARREFGNISLVREVTRDQWPGIWLEELWQDLRYAARMLRKNPGFTLVAVLTLALGIGANTAIFSIVNGILLRPLPYPHPERLVQVTGSYPKGGVAAMRERMRTVDTAGYDEGWEFNLIGTTLPVRLTATLVSANFFDILGVEPQLGRTFRPGEDLAGQNDSVVLTFSVWQRLFAGDPAIVGHFINLEGAQYKVLGVMPADFKFPSPQTDLWLPLKIDPRDSQDYWGNAYMPVLGRLRTGATPEQAAAEVRVFDSQVRELFPWRMPASWNAGATAVPLQTGLVSDVRTRLLILLTAVTLVLLIACANVANLVLSRAAFRAKEISVRVSLGAGRSRIVRQLVTESVLMAALGGAFGLALAAGGLSALKSILPTDTPRLSDVSLDWRVLLFTGGLAILTGIAFGIAPALQASRAEVIETLKGSGSRGATHSRNPRLRAALVTAELGLAVLLVSGASLLLRSLWELTHVNPGFRSENVLTARVTPHASFCKDAARCFSFYRDFLGRTRALPGVIDAAFISTLPLGGRVQKRTVHLEGYVPGAGEPEPLLWLNAVSAGYFHAMGISVLRGREFTDADSSGSSHAAILSADTARRFWPNQEALGKHIQLVREKDWCTVVGIVPEIRAYDLRRSVPSWLNGTIYLPYGPGLTLQDGSVPAEMTLVLRSKAEQARLEESVRQLAASINQDTPIAEVKPMESLLSNAVAAPRSVTALFGAFAGLALILGIVGIYGVIAFFVGQRTREIGVRVALGAQRGDILKLVLRQGLSLTFFGVVGGLAAAAVLTRFLGSLLYGVSPTDPLDFIVVAVLFAVVAVAACYIPARRAMRIDPLVALRYE